MPRTVLVILALLVLSPGLQAGESAQALRAGKLLDIENGTYLTDVLLHIKDGRISKIESTADSVVPDDVIDLSGYTVLPGLIDVHTHLCDNTYLGEAWDWWTLPSPSLGIAGTVNAKKVLNAGFTTVRNVSESFYCGVSLRDAISLGMIDGPRMYTSGPMITMTGGHGAAGNWMAPQHQLPPTAGAIADGVDEVRRETRTQIKHGVDLIKIATTGGFGTPGTIPAAASYTVDELRAVVDEARKRGLTVAAHAHGVEGIKNAIHAGAHSIEHATLMDEATIQLLKEHEVYIVPDLLAAYYDLVETDQDFEDKKLEASNKEEYQRYAARVANAHHQGVQIAFGTDSGVYPHGRNAEQFALLVEAGIEPLDAIRSATIVAARLLGIEDHAGHLDAGTWADLIAVQGDPLVDVSILTDVRFVMKAGSIYRRDSQR